MVILVVNFNDAGEGRLVSGVKVVSKLGRDGLNAGGG